MSTGPARAAVNTSAAGTSLGLGSTVGQAVSSAAAFGASLGLGLTTGQASENVIASAFGISLGLGLTTGRASVITPQPTERPALVKGGWSGYLRSEAYVKKKKPRDKKKDRDILIALAMFDD